MCSRKVGYDIVSAILNQKRRDYLETTYLHLVPCLYVYFLSGGVELGWEKGGGVLVKLGFTTIQYDKRGFDWMEMDVDGCGIG